MTIDEEWAEWLAANQKRKRLRNYMIAPYVAVMLFILASNFLEYFRIISITASCIMLIGGVISLVALGFLHTWLENRIHPRIELPSVPPKRKRIEKWCDRFYLVTSISLMTIFLPYTDRHHVPWYGQLAMMFGIIFVTAGMNALLIRYLLKRFAPETL